MPVFLGGRQQHAIAQAVKASGAIVEGLAPGFGRHVEIISAKRIWIPQ